ncbi:MAG: phenylalanine--tRNA ligase subunit beta [Lactobacillales bacterium]|jgi:phenylalanyl-tRNA synthetase beta chain|nr:phenylalanine--tRNA ligase subunit beta [Lactobacillales bacterium]
MLVSYKWLSEYLDLTAIKPKELADKMSLTGIEVEGTEVLSAGLKKIVVGEVKECVDHPDSDHLHICQVDVGEEELYQIVCGAPNVKAGIKVIVALPGARIAGNYKIKKGKIRGQVSLGMICSLQELGINESVVPKEFSDGIYYMPEEAVIGEEVFKYLDMDDTIIELSITPNRADALSMRGVAYEVGAIYDQKPHFKKEELVEDTSDSVENYVSVKVEDENDTPTYKMRVIKDVKIAPSPLWLQNRLRNEGIRPINNVVDVTNYILLYFGQPLHAFDQSKLTDKEILVRRAKAGETLVTLDEEERQLSSDNIVITNGGQPVALAGVMGGASTEIDDNTTSVALEAALFEPISIRRTSKEFNLRSESSARFEKGINKATVQQALDVASAMIAKLAGGIVVSGTVTGSEFIPEEVVVGITLERINGYLGTTLSVEEVNHIFEALGFEYEVLVHDYSVKIPPRRWDISIEADIIEEVARIFGYDNLPSTLPTGAATAGGLTTKQELTRVVRTTVEGSGLQEIISYALTTEEKSRQFNLVDSNITKLDWPMSEERSALRLSLISGLLDNVAYNIARKNTNLAFYEVGRVFLNNGNPLKELPTEENRLSVALTGSWVTKDWQTAKTPVDFFTLKGILENLFAKLGILETVTYEALGDVKELHPGRSAKIMLGDKLFGFIGQVHPQTAKTYDIPETYVAELSLDVISEFEHAALVFGAVSKFPEVNRDVALLVSEDVTNQQLSLDIHEAGGKFLIAIDLFDVYQGSTIEAGKKSMGYSLTFSNPEATLTDEEINKAMEKIEKKLVDEYQVEIR